MVWKLTVWSFCYVFHQYYPFVSGVARLKLEPVFLIFRSCFYKAILIKPKTTSFKEMFRKTYVFVNSILACAKIFKFSFSYFFLLELSSFLWIIYKTLFRTLGWRIETPSKYDGVSLRGSTMECHYVAQISHHFDHGLLFHLFLKVIKDVWLYEGFGDY